MKTYSNPKSNRFFVLLQIVRHLAWQLVLFGLLSTVSMAQGGGCGEISYTLVNYEPCHYRVVVDNNSECYPFIRVLIDGTEFADWQANTAGGWTGELINPSEILLTHNSGKVPFGTSLPLEFSFPPDVVPQLTFLWDYACPPGEGCFFEIALDGCTAPADASISGTVYVDIGCAGLLYNNQPVLAGWTVDLTDAFGTIIASTDSDTSGFYAFYDLPPGNYICRITVDSGWTSKVPPSGEYLIDLGPSEDEVANFGMCRNACSCFDVETTVNMISSDPAKCCYNLTVETEFAGSYCFQYIYVQVDAGQTITSWNIIPGYTATLINPQFLELIPNSGLVAPGTTFLGAFCVTGTANHDILVITGFGDSGGSYECNSINSFNCPYCSCPPPTELKISEVEPTSALLTFVPADCSETTWIIIEDGNGNAIDHIVLATETSFFFDSLMPGTDYRVYTFSNCGDLMSGTSDTVYFTSGCTGCTGNLVVNPGLDGPNPYPFAADQLSLCPDWSVVPESIFQPINSIPDWFSWGNSIFTGTNFPGITYDITNQQYVILPAQCPRRYGGIDISKCEGIKANMSQTVGKGDGYQLSFWWTPKEPSIGFQAFSVYLSNNNQICKTSYAEPYGCTSICGSPNSYIIDINSTHTPGTWYQFTATANAKEDFDAVVFMSRIFKLNPNLIYIDEVCVKKVFLPCDAGKPRITHNPEQPGAFFGEVDLSAGSSLVSAVWDFGDGTTDSSDVLGSVIHDFAPGTYEVCLTVTAMDTSGTTCSNSTCITVDVVPLSDPCDDVSAFLQYTGGCCYQLIINTNDPSTFTQLDVTLSSGDFVNSQLQGTWNTTLNGSMASFLPTPGPFIPAGQDVPVILCDPNGTDPYTVDVDFLYNGGVCNQTFNLSCDPNQCTCQGFQDLEFYNFLGLPDMPVTCNDPVSVQLPCIGSDAVYNFQGNFLCQGVCTPSTVYEIYQVNGPLVLSGSSIPSSFKFAPGDYMMVLNGFCGPDTCTCTILFTIPDCGGTCVCTANSYAVGFQLPGSPIQPISCGQTVQVDPGDLFSILTSFQCQGTGCNPTDQVSWSFTGPGGLSIGSSATASPNFSVPPVTLMAYSTPGTYTLDMYGICGLQDTCRCTVYIEVKDTCCDDQAAFLAAAATVQTFGTLGSCTLSFQATGLDSCMQIRYDWGDNSTSGPFGNNILVSHHYGSPGTYWVCDTIEELDAQGNVCWSAIRCDSVLVLCDTCYCGGFSGISARPSVGGQSVFLPCGGAPVSLGCPVAGFPVAITGLFECEGTTCPQSTLLHCAIYGPTGSWFMNTVASPYFYRPLIPAIYALPGLYTVVFDGPCGGQQCATCVVQFTIDCQDPCPCNVQDFQADIAKGFATALWNNSCKGCFSPVALDDCDEVMWSVNGGAVLSTTNGTQSFCHTFPGGGTQVVTMTVVRRKNDGTVCAQATISKTINLNCLKAPDCNSSVVENTGFNNGAVSGGLASGGASGGWKALWGDPHVQEGIAGVSDGWSIELSGKLDTSDVLSTMEAFCLDKDTGTIRMRVARVLPNGPDELSQVNFGCKLSVQLFRGEDYTFSYPNWNPIRCLSTVSLDVTPLDTGWVDIVIPYDISGWDVSDDTCGNGPQTVYVRPVIYITNALSMDQGGDATRTRVRVDYFCLDGTLTALQEINKSSALHVYPNPTTGQVTVSWDQPLPTDARLVFSDVVGNEVYAMRPEGLNTSVVAELGHLPPGVYFLNVRSLERSFDTVKVIKQ